MSGLDVLMVEDNPLNLELARDLLELEGHAVRACEDGAALRRALARDPAPSVVLMDIMLPDASGADLLLEVKACAAWAAVPVVALTAHASAAEIERLRGLGFVEVLTKPIDTRTFVANVERLSRAG